MDVVVSDAGMILEPFGSALRQLLRYDRPGLDLANYAVRNMGFARFSQRGRDIRIALRSRLLTRACFQQLVFLLCADDFDRVIIRDHDSPSVPELYSDYDDVVGRLDELRGLNPAETPRLNFFSTTLDLKRLKDRRRSQLARYYRRWKACDGRVDRHADPLLAASAYMPGVFLLEIGIDGAAYIRTWPSHITLYSPCVRLALIGRDVSEQPDIEFGTQVSVRIRESAWSGEPKFELIEAIIRPPGEPARRTRYERLVLPWTAGGRTAFVGTMSIIRSRRFCAA